MNAPTRSRPAHRSDGLRGEPAAPHASAARASEAGPFDPVRVWDAPTRVVQWLMAACLAGAWATAGASGWQMLHETLGATVVGLAVFRIAWGFAGTRHARFASFVKGPRAIARCVRRLPHGWAARHIGHSPAGAVLLIAVLLLALLAGASGWASAGDPAAGWLRGLHEGAAHAMLAIAGLHMAAIVFGHWRAGEKLLPSMLRGTRLGTPAEAISGARRGVAWLVVAAVLGFWWYQWKSAAHDPEPPVPMALAVRG